MGSKIIHRNGHFLIKHKYFISFLDIYHVCYAICDLISSSLLHGHSFFMQATAIFYKSHRKTMSGSKGAPRRFFYTGTVELVLDPFKMNRFDKPMTGAK